MRDCFNPTRVIFKNKMVIRYKMGFVLSPFTVKIIYATECYDNFFFQKRLKKCPLKTSTEYEKNRTYLSLK